MIEQNSNLPPQFAEYAQRDWILYGEQNDYPDYLVELYRRSSIHSAIIDGKHLYICGGGFKPDANLPEDQIKIVEEFFKSVNQDGDSLEDVIYPAILDWLISGNFALKGKYGILTKKPKDLYYKDWSMYRLSLDDKSLYGSKWWVFNNKGRKQIYSVKPTDIEQVGRFRFDRRQDGIIYHRNPRPQLRAYGLPEYESAITDIETDISIAEFHNNNVKSGFSAGYIIEFLNGAPTQDEKDQVVTDLREKYTEARKGGELFVIFSESKERGVNVIPIRPNDLDKQFEQLRKDVNQSIITRHGITSPMLMAIKTEGQLGGNNEILSAAELFQNKYVSPKQRVIEKLVNKWFTAKYGFDAGIYIEKLKPVKEKLSISEVKDKLTDDEQRELAGLPPATKEQKAELDSKKKQQAELKLMADDGTEDLLQALKLIAKDPEGEFIGERACLTEEDFSDEAIDKFMSSFQAYASVFDLPYYQSIVYQYLEKASGAVDLGKMSKDTGVAKEQLELALNQLQSQNYINFQIKDGKISSVKINPISDAALKEGIPAYRLTTRWKYSGPNDDRTRPFCRRMLNEVGLAGKLWDRQEINQLSIQEGRNVWLTRGGWYTLPNGNKRPSCRHYWSQVIYKLKV